MTSQPLKWHGGKRYLARRIIELMPPHLHYVEPYFGGGAVLFAKPCEGVSEVVNDIDGELVNFWRVLQGDGTFGEFARIVSVTPFSEPDWRGCLPADATCVWDAPVGYAVTFFIRYRQSRQGLGKDFATLSRTRTRRGMNEQASAWLSAVEGLPEAHERLKRVVIFFRDALDVIRQQDGPRTHFYCDPPYLHETRTATNCYEHEMSAFDHACLLSLLATPERASVIHKPPDTPTWTDEQWRRLTDLYEVQLDGTFQLSGYHSYMYDEMAATQRWRCDEIDLPNNASSAKQKERKTECVWMNY